MRIVVGELRNDLVTNQSLVGKTIAQAQELPAIQLKLYDYALRPLEVQSISVQNPSAIKAFTVDATPTDHILGVRGESTNLNAKWSVTGNTMDVIINPFGLEEVINSIASYRLQQLTTTSGTYTKFRFLQQ